MLIRDVMTRDVATCSPNSSLSDAAEAMRNHDCGFVPLVDPADHELRGIVTDRDVCMAAYSKGLPLREIRAGAVMHRDPETCRADDDVSIAHQIMRTKQVRRLPVLDRKGMLVGVVSLNDLVVTACDRKDEKMEKDVAITLGEICRHRAISTS